MSLSEDCKRFNNIVYSDYKNVIAPSASVCKIIWILIARDLTNFCYVSKGKQEGLRLE